MSIGLTLPFSKASGSVGYFETTRDELSAIKQNLRSLMLTNWGERVMHHNMGCNLVEFLFENNDQDELRLKISDRIISQVSMWMPFVTINEITVLFQDDVPSMSEHAIGVRIKFAISGKPDMSGILDVDVNNQ